MKHYRAFTAINRFSLIIVRIMLLLSFILSSSTPAYAASNASSASLEDSVHLANSTDHSPSAFVSSATGDNIAYEHPPFVSLSSIKTLMGRNEIAQDTLALADVKLYCKEIAGNVCAGTEPATTIALDEFSGGYYGTYKRIGISCTGPGCSRVPIYYSLQCHEEWTSFLTLPAEYFSISISSRYGNYSLGRSVPCGGGNGGTCDLTINGVVPGYALSGDPRYAYIDQWFKFNLPSSRWHLDQECKMSWSLYPIVLDQSSLSSNGPKGSTGDSRECALNHCADTQGTAGDPINTRTGNLDYSLVDLSVQTPAGPLSFQRSYSSQAIDTSLYPTIMGPGWTHNQDLYLLFDDVAKEVIFKGPTSNQYKFVLNTTAANGDKTYFTYGGVTATLTYTAATMTYTIIDGSKSVYQFDAAGQLISWRTKADRGYDYSYVDGKLYRVTEPQSQRYFEFAYNIDNKLESVSDSAGRSIAFTYDANGDLSTFTDATGQLWAYGYGLNTYDLHRLTTVTAPDGITILTTNYDSKGRAYEQFNANNERIINILFDDVGTKVGADLIYQNQIFDGKDQVSVDTYTGNKTLANQDDPTGYSTARVYDQNLRLSQITDESGRASIFNWDSTGANLTGVTDAAGNSSTLGYDTLNNLTSVIDPLSHQTLFTYDGALLTSTTNALSETTSYTYTADGQVETVTTPGGTTTYGYDALGQQTSMMLPDDSTWQYGYDDLGRMISTTDPLGRVTKTEYDAAGRITRTIVNYDPLKLQNEENIYNITTVYAYDENGNQTSVTDTYGNVTQSIYDDAGRLIESIDAANQSTTYQYDLNGNLVLTTDPLGHTTGYTYNTTNQLLTTTDALGHVTTNVYNVDGTLAKTIDALNRETRYTYDNLKRVVDTIDALGNTTHSDYDANGNLLSTTAPNGAVTSYEYDALGRVIREHNPLGGITQSFYDPAGNLSETIDPRGNSTTYAYDAQGRMTSQTDALGNITLFAYDVLGNRSTVEDPLGHVTTYTYNALGMQTNSQDALGQNSSSAYNALGQLISSVDTMGRVTTYEYDELGRLITQTDNLGGVTANTYDAFGNLLTTTDQNLHTTTMTYNAVGQMQTRTDPNLLTTTYYYDAVGNLARQVDAAGNETIFAYDAMNRQIQVTDPSGVITKSEYDSVGNQVKKIDGKNIVTQYEYDLMGNLTAVVENKTTSGTVDAQTNVRTEYQYDANGNLVAIVDANGATSSTRTYDELNRLASEADALGNTTTYAYDAAGNLSQKVDPNGTIIVYTYDELNRLLTTDYPGTANDVTYAYTADGQHSSMIDATGTTTWTYDGLGLIESVTDPFANMSIYSYDAVGNRTGIEYPDGKVVAYAYDAGNRLSTVTDWQSLAATYAYIYANLVSSVTLPNGVVSSFTYDQSGRLLSLTHTLGGNVIGSYVYTYDGAGNRATATEFLSTGEELMGLALDSVASNIGTPEPSLESTELLTPELNRTITYTYDPLNRLTNAAYSDGANYAYTYDALGNRLTETTAVRTNTYTYDTAGRLSTVNGTAYTWDNNGNLLSDGTKTYTYDLANRLTSLTDGMNSFAYAYNGLGDRVQSTVNGVTIQYALDLNAGLTQVLNDGVNTYVYGYTRLAQVNDAETGYFLTDALGSVRQVTDATGAITLVRDYSPYGETVQTLGDFQTDFSFTGEMTDASGLVYLRARYYDPATGRFVSRDTWEGVSQAPLSLNKWAYTEGDPVNFADPSGMWRWYLTPSTYHLILENYYEGMLGSNPFKQLEYPIPGTPFRHADMFNSITGDVYEIEPFFLRSNATAQVAGYVTDLTIAAKFSWLTGNRYLGVPYNWNFTPFHSGTGIDWPGKYRKPLAGFPMADLVADFVGSGTVIYWIEPNALAYGALPFLVPNKRLVRPQNWNPGLRVSQPVTAMSFEEACGYGFIAMGGTIIVVTIIEDVMTLGLGVFDDVVTVPTGYYFINLGLRMAAFVPGS